MRFEQRESKANELVNVAIRNGGAECLKNLFIEAIQFGEKGVDLQRATKKKRCNKCNIVKLSIDFYKQPRGKDGLRNDCIDCFKLAKQARDTGNTGITRKQYEQEQREGNLYILKQKGLQQIKQYNLIILKAAMNAEYASKGIVVGGKLLKLPIKVCSKCEQQYPQTTDYFWGDNRRVDGLNAKCKYCATGKENPCIYLIDLV